MTIFQYEGEAISGYRKPEVCAYEYLSLSTRPEIALVRSFIDELFGQYSLDNKDDLCARLQSEDDAIFESTITELITYSSLKRIGIKPIQAEPESFTEKGRPDFLCEYVDGNLFLVEVKTIFEHSSKDAAAIKRFNPLRAKINKIKNTDFFISLDIRKHPSETIDATKIAGKIAQWLEGLDYDLVKASTLQKGALPGSEFDFHWKDRNLEFILRPIPRGSTRGKLTERLIGLEGGGGWSDGATKIKKAIKDKASKYGSINIPYFVLINSTGFFHDLEDIGEALFGTVSYYVSEKEAGKPLNWWQKTDGLLGSVGSPSYTRLSGVIYLRGLNAFSIERRTATFIPNPFAKNNLKPIPSFFKKFDQLDNPYHGCLSMSLGKLFKLPEGWPEV